MPFLAKLAIGVLGVLGIGAVGFSAAKLKDLIIVGGVGYIAYRVLK